MDFDLVPATENERAFIYALYRDCMKPFYESFSSWDESERRRRFDEDFDGENISLIALEDFALGYIDLRESDDDITIAELHIVTSARKNGIGTAVLDDICGFSDMRGISINGKCFKTDESMIRVFEKCGFVRSGETDCEYIYAREPVQ